MLTADVGPDETGRRSSCTATSTSCPGFAEQFAPRVEGDRLIGRGAYDMKGGLAAMMCALARLRRPAPACACASSCVPDEESEDVDARSTDDLVARGLRGGLRDHRRADRPAHRRPGQGRAGDARSRSRGRAAHGSTPWLGDNAILKAIDVFRRIETLPFARESSELFDRPSINLGRIEGGDAFNKVPDQCRDGRRHPLPARPGPGRRSSSRSARSPTSRS